MKSTKPLSPSEKWTSGTSSPMLSDRPWPHGDGRGSSTHHCTRPPLLRRDGAFSRRCSSVFHGFPHRTRGIIMFHGVRPSSPAGSYTDHGYDPQQASLSSGILSVGSSRGRRLKPSLLSPAGAGGAAPFSRAHAIGIARRFQTVGGSGQPRRLGDQRAAVREHSESSPES